MAKIVKKNNHLESEYSSAKNDSKSNIVGFLTIFLISFACIFAYKEIDSPIFIIAAGILLIFGVISLQSGSKHAEEEKNILVSGIVGENSTADLLSCLPDGYTVFQDVVVRYDGKVSEIDNIVVGNTGVFVIETKNHNGTINGDYGEKDWLQSKVGRGGTPYYNSFYSPVKQVGTHIFRLKNVLKENGIHVYINGAVYFSNPQATVSISGDETDIPVFAEFESGGEDLLDYILNGDANLSEPIVKRINKLLD